MLKIERMNIYSEKLRLVLNELAILNQPEQRNGIFFYGLSQIRRIKELAAEAYILADLASTESARAKVPLETPNTTVEKIMRETQEPVKEEPKIIEPEPMAEEEEPAIEEPVQEIEVESAPEPENEPEPEIAEVIEPEPISPVEVPEMIEVIEEIEVPEEEVIEEEEIEEAPEPKMEESVNNNQGSRAGEFSKTVSMTRRFEYINKLFKGNSEEYNRLVNKIESLDKAAVLKSFSDCYYNLEWNRNQESADEFKSLIVKFFD